MWIPSNYTPRSHQLEAHESRKRFTVLKWHRRAGKTQWALAELLSSAMIEKGSYFFIGVTHGSLKRSIWEAPEALPSLVPHEIWQKRNNSDLKLPLPNGSILNFVSGNVKDALLGAPPKGVIFDEFDSQNIKLWHETIEPILRANGGWAIFIGTPRESRNLTRLEGLYRQHEDWFISRLRASASGVITQQELEEIKRTTPENIYLREYEVEDVAGSNAVFPGLKNCLYNTKESPVYVQQGERFHLGVDIAKVNDWTVLTPISLSDFKVHPQVRFNQVDYTLQSLHIENAFNKYNKAKVILDGTGVGAPMVDSLRRTIPIHPYVFTEQSRRDLIDNLRLLIEQQRIGIPNDPGLIEEMESMTFNVTATGKIRAEVPDNMHDDRIMSLALACWGLPYNLIPVSSTIFKKPFNDQVDKMWAYK